MRRKLSERDSTLLVELCERGGLDAVLYALAERCAFESQSLPGRGDAVSRRWDEAFRSVHHAAETVAAVADALTPTALEST
jgi:hypothetical protein